MNVGAKKPGDSVAMSNSRRELLKGALRLAAATPLLLRPLSAATTTTRFPYLQNVRPDRATILWATGDGGIGSVQFSTDSGMAGAVMVPAQSRRFNTAETRMDSAFTQYEAELTGLAPDTRYYYRALVDGQDAAPGVVPQGQTFRTAPLSGGFRFCVFGDSGANTPEQYRLRDRMLGDPAALILHVGDIVYPFGAHQIYEDYYLKVYRDMMRRLPLFPAPGNHDVEADAGAAYTSLHPVPTETVPEAERRRYYSFDWGDAHFVSLDSNLVSDAVRSPRMLAWLSADLEATRKQWKIVYFHHAPYDPARGNEPETRLSRELIAPILEQYGVNIVFVGHNHVYQRTFPLLRHQKSATGEGVTYVTVGGGGGGLYGLNPDPLLFAAGESAYHYVQAEIVRGQFTVRAIHEDGREIDRFVIAPRPVFSRESTVNSASFSPALAPGSLITIFGRNLSAEEGRVASPPLPTELGGARVTLNGRALPLLLAFSGQINAQIPYGIDGASTLEVTTPNGAAQTAVMIQPVAPGIFGSPRSPAIVHLDGRLVSSLNPAAGGEVVSIYLTGLGEVRGGQVPAGAPAPITPLLETAARVQIDLGGGALADPLFAGLAPGFAGLYQINVRLPGGIRGRRDLSVLANGVRSNVVQLETA